MKMIFVMLLLAGILFPSYSAEFEFYGKVRLGAWWEKHDRWHSDTVGLYVDSTIDQIIIGDTLWFYDTTGAELGADSLPMNYITLIPNGYLGIKFETNKLEIVVEAGVKENMYSGRNSCVTSNKFLARRNDFFTMRKWSINWHLNEYFSFLFGKDVSPVNFVPSNQGYYDMNGFANTGGICGGSNPMIQFKAGNPSSTVRWEGKIAALNPDTTFIEFKGKTNTKVGMKAPKFESSFNIGYNSDNFELLAEACYGFQRYYLSCPLEGKPVDSCEGNVDAYVAGGHLKCKIGPVSLDWTGALGKNLGNYGLYITNPWVWFGEANAVLVDIFYAIWPPEEDIQNSFAREMAVVLKVQLSENFSVEWGGGIVHAEHDVEYYNKMWHDTYATYLQTEIQITEGLFITPEAGFYYYGPEIGFGKRIYAGTQIRAEF